MRIRYFAALFLAAAAFAQPPADSKPAAVEGTVVNSVTGAPLRKVGLTLSNGEVPGEMAAMREQFGGHSSEMPKVSTKTFAATTDAAGKFHFDNLPPDTYWITVKKAGFGDQRYKPKGAAAGARGSLRLAAGQELKDVEIRLVPHGTISGRVLDEDGDPFPSAMVSALASTFVHGRRRLMPADAGQTNNRGEFSLSKLPPGHYVLCASIPHFSFPSSATPPPADGAPETAYVSTYMPNSTDPAQAEKVDITPGGEVTGLEIHMQESVVIRVKGRLTDETGQPIKNAYIELMAGGGRVGSKSMTSVNDPEGKFELANVQPGASTITIVQMQGSSPKITMQPLIVPERGIENLKLGARADATIQGKVAVDGDAKFPLKDFALMLTPAEVASMPATAKADETGAFTLAHVAPAVYDLTFSFVPEGAYIKSVEFNGREALGHELDCSSLTAGTLRVLLGADGGKVEGHVSRDDKPAADATVVLVPADPNRRFPEAVRQGSSDERGQVTLKDVPPGDYLAFAWEKIEEGAWYDPSFLRTVENQAVKVQIRPKAAEQVELKPIPAAQ
ncbi:MAG: carboxypeptidase regulatory-like domain-containing protein [Bryobacteraceae bacterium]